MKKKKILSILLITMMLMTETAFSAETSALRTSEAALKNINSGIASVNDYVIVGLDGVTYMNLDTINAVIKIDVKDKNKDLSKEEIEKVIKGISNKISEANKRVPSGNGKLVDYAVLGITNVTDKNINDVNWYLKGKDNSTINKIKSNVSAIVSAMNLINKGSAQSSYYNKIGIEKVNSNNVKVITNAVAKARKDSTENLTREQVVEIANTNLREFDNSMSRINNGEGTKKDYIFLEILSITESNINDVNWYVKEKDNSTLMKLQDNVNLVVAALTNINNGTCFWRYYNRLGSLDVNADNIKYVNNDILEKRLLKGSNLTRQEIVNNSKSAVSKFDGIIPKVKSGNGTLDNYLALGFTIVTQDNLADVNQCVKGKDNSTFEKLKNNINQIVDDLKSINEGKIDWRYYSRLGITTVNAKNVKAVSEAVKSTRTQKDRSLTRTEILRAVESVTGVSEEPNTQDPEVAKKEKLNEANTRINNGQGKISDYELIGVTSVTVDNIDDVNWYVKNKDNKTKTKLQNNINMITFALKYINSGSKSITYYKRLEINNVNSSNVSMISADIKNAKIKKGKNLNRNEIINCINTKLNKSEDANNKIKSGTASVSDYELLGITVVNSNNLSDVNAFLEGKDMDTTDKIKYNVNIIVTGLKNINLGINNYKYYNNIGLNDVTSKNITEVRDAVKKARDLKKSDLTKSEIENAIKSINKSSVK